MHLMKKIEMKKEDKYTKALNRIKADGGIRAWMLKPFNTETKTMATNAYSLLTVPLIDGFENHSDKVKSVYPLEHKVNKPISLDEIKEKLKSFPMVDAYDENEEEKECEACDGDGMVEYCFDHAGRSYYYDAECPVCDGAGYFEKTTKTPNGKREFDPKKYFKIGNANFNIGRIEELFDVAEIIDEPITVVYEDNKKVLFSIGDVELLCMATYGDFEVSASIEL